MADKIINKCSQLRITEDEGDIIAMPEGSNDSIKSTLELAIVGKVLSVRPYNFEAFKKTMTQIWLISKKPLFRALNNGLLFNLPVLVIERKFWMVAHGHFTKT